MSEQNKATVRRVIEEGFGKGNVDFFDEVLAEDYVGYGGAPEPLRGPEAVKQFVMMYRSAFPDMETRVDEIVAEGDTVACRWSARGTHQGDLFGVCLADREAGDGLGLQLLALLGRQGRRGLGCVRHRRADAAARSRARARRGVAARICGRRARSKRRAPPAAPEPVRLRGEERAASSSARDAKWRLRSY